MTFYIMVAWQHLIASRPFLNDKIPSLKTNRNVSDVINFQKMKFAGRVGLEFAHHGSVKMFYVIQYQCSLF